MLERAAFSAPQFSNLPTRQHTIDTSTLLKTSRHLMANSAGGNPFKLNDVDHQPKNPGWGGNVIALNPGVGTSEIEVHDVQGGIMLHLRKLSLFLTVFAIAVLAGPGAAGDDRMRARVDIPLDLAILIQDDVVSHVGNELDI